MITRRRWRGLTVRQLRTHRSRLARAVPDLEATLGGALHRQMRQCGKAGCRCADGELHGPYMYLSVRMGGGRRVLYGPAEAVNPGKRRGRVTGPIEAARAEISAINLELHARGEVG